MSAQLEPSHFDIEYLHQHSVKEVTELDEEIFIELVGKNVSDGMTDAEARDKAFKCIFHR